MLLSDSSFETYETGQPHYFELEKEQVRHLLDITEQHHYYSRRRPVISQ